MKRFKLTIRCTLSNFIQLIRNHYFNNSNVMLNAVCVKRKFRQYKCYLSNVSVLLGVRLKYRAKLFTTSLDCPYDKCY